MKDGPCGDRSLTMTTVTLKNLSFSDRAVSVVATIGTDKPIGPSQLEYFMTTLIFRSVLLHEIWQTHAFLKLYFIFGHVFTSYFQGVASHTISMNRAENRW